VATSPPLGFFIEDITAALAALSIAFHGSWRLTLLIFSCAIPALGIVWLTSRKYESAIEAQKQELALASKLAITSIAAVETVKVFNGQNQEANLYKDTIEGAGNSYLSQAHISSLRLGISRFMSIAMFCVSFWYGASQVNQGLSIGSILTTFYACFLAAQSMQSYQAQLLLLSKGRSAGSTLKRLIIEMTNRHRVHTLEGSLRPESCKGEVRVSNVSICDGTSI
jgi:ATP-binding cassette, subfamily B (MDR/TAP), member 1